MDIIQYPDSPFKLHRPFAPAGDQPTAIAGLDAATREAVSAMLLQEQAQCLLIVVSHQPPVQADFQILRLQEKA